MDFFALSKLFWFFAAPSHVLIWLLLVGLALSGRLIGKILLGLGTICLLLLLFIPLGDWAINRLENQYKRGPWPQQVDGVLELGGGFSPAVLRSRGVPGADAGEGRVVAAFEVARRYPNARIVFTGGTGDPGNSPPEVTVAKAIFDQLGLAPGRVLYEGRARDTWENFIFSRDLVKPRPGETWLLVTSAYHMPRAMAVARRVGWKVQAWPSDYLTPVRSGWYGEDFDVNLSRLDLAAHEWVGLLAYRLDGRAR